MSHPRAAFRPPLALSIIALSTAALSLSACASVTLTALEPAPSASVSEPVDPTLSPSPTPTPTPSAAVRPAVLPTDCAKVVSPASYDGFFLGTPLNDPGFVDPSLVGSIAPVPPPAGATPAETVYSAVELNCVWRDPNADITGLYVAYSRVDAAIAAQHL